MGKAEYIVRFKGDYSALQKDLAKINAATTKLENDEVIIKLNYDGNITEFNKQFDKIAKMHPELGIQFQYNVNEKMLNQEIDKLKKLTELKLDIDEGNVQNKLKNLANNVEASLQEGLSKDEITKRLKEFFGYYNTSIKAGAKNIDFDFDSLSNKLFDAFKNQKDEIKEIYDDIWNQNDTKEIKLFEIDQSIDNDISKTQERVTDLKDALDSLEKKGASKSGLPSELQKVQDEVKILRADISKMQEQLKDLSGEAFNNMAQQIKNTNEQLDFALQKISDLKTALKQNGIKQNNSIGGVVKQWQDEEITKSRERYTAFNSQTKKTSGAHVAAEAEGVSMKLMRSAIKELGDDADGTIHSHPQKFAAFSDDDIDLYYKLFQEGITQQIVTSSQEAISLDMTKVNIDKGNEVVELIKSRYKEIDDKFLNNLQLSIEEIKEAITPILNVKSSNPIINSVIKTIKDNYDDLFDGVMNLEDFSEVFETNADYILKQIPEYKQLSNRDKFPILQGIAGWIDLAHDAVLDGVAENVQKEYQSVLQEVFTNPTFLKSGEKSAIKIQAISDFIDWGSITDTAKDAAKKAADALQEAQDSNSPAELTKPLGKDFTEGYAEGIREAIPDVVKACKEVVLAAYNAIKEAKTSEDGESVDFSEGFINSFKESLDRAVPTIQEKIKEVFSKINIGDENSSMFEGIGQEIIDSIIVGLKNAHSGESFTASLESIINNAFTQVALDSAVRDFLVQIQTTMDTQGNLRLKYFSVDTDSIIFEIQNGLDNNTFNINLGGTIQDLSTVLNTSADNVRMSFIDAIKWMQQANEWQKTNNKEETHERGLWFNSKTGEFSNPTVVGDKHSVSYKISKEILEHYKNQGIIFDTDLHSHQDFDYAAPSGFNGDLGYFFNHAFQDNINKFIVMAQKEFAVFDFSKIADSVTDFRKYLFEWLANNLNEIVRVIGEKKPNQSNYQYLMSYIDTIYHNLWTQIRENLKRDAATIESSNADMLLTDMYRNFDSQHRFDLQDQITGESSSVRVMFSNLRHKVNEEISDEPGIKGLIKTDKIFNSIMERILENFREQIRSMDDDILDKNDIENQINDAVSEAFSSGYYDDLSNLKEIFVSDITEYMVDQFLKSSYSLPRLYTEEESRALHQEAGSMAMKELISSNDLIGRLVKYYDYDEFEREFGKGIIQSSQKQSNNSLPSSTIPEDFQAQLQNAMDESGKYIVKVYGELIEDFKSRLQNAIDETGLYHVDIEGWLYDTFHDGLQRDIDGQEKYIIEVKGRLFDTFKEVLQEAIDGLGAFPIEVKPYMRKGGEIEEVDLPSGNQTPVSTEDNTSEIEAETKAYVKKSDAIEQLRSNIDNLKKVEADKLINENFSKNEKGRFQIEQTALDELIASLKEKKQIEESATPTTSPVTDNMQSEVETVNQAIEAEKKKFDELKNKISKTIPKAIETKNKAFEKEGNLVAKIVDDEITYFEVLKDSVDNVTDSIEKQQNSVKDLNSKSKSKNPKKSEDTTDKIDKEALLRQHNTELFRNYAQSIGQKSQVQQDMSAYYAQLEKDSAKAYSDAEKKANSLLGKVKKLQNSNKYTQDFVEKLNSAENELTNFLKELSEGTISFDEVDSRVKILSENIENTLSKKAFGNVKQAAEKSLTNVGLKIDQIIAKNSAMGKDFESRFKALRRSLESETTIEGVQKIIAEVNKLESELIATGNTGKSFIDQIKQRLRDINSKYIAQYFSFQDIIRYARQAATNVIQLNDAFIELSKVSNTSLETLERDFQSYADIAHDIGGTISDTINATADWARMGMINAPLYGNI